MFVFNQETLDLCQPSFMCLNCAKLEINFSPHIKEVLFYLTY